MIKANGSLKIVVIKCWKSTTIIGEVKTRKPKRSRADIREISKALKDNKFQFFYSIVTRWATVLNNLTWFYINWLVLTKILFSENYYKCIWRIISERLIFLTKVCFRNSLLASTNMAIEFVIKMYIVSFKLILEMFSCTFWIRNFL